jgi:hypothetical protein
MSPCPFCGSDDIYPLLNTLRCKRCKGIWKVEAPDPFSPGYSCPLPHFPPLPVRKRTEPLAARLERQLDTVIKRSGGKFTFSGTLPQTGDIPQDLFRHFVRQCVKDGVLIESTDCRGRTWYFRP